MKCQIAPSRFPIFQGCGCSWLCVADGTNKAFWTSSSRFLQGTRIDFFSFPLSLAPNLFFFHFHSYSHSPSLPSPPKKQDITIIMNNNNMNTGNPAGGKEDYLDKGPTSFPFSSPLTFCDGQMNRIQQKTNEMAY